MPRDFGKEDLPLIRKYPWGFGRMSACLSEGMFIVRSRRENIDNAKNRRKKGRIKELGKRKENVRQN